MTSVYRRMEGMQKWTQRTVECADVHKEQWKVQIDTKDNGRYRWTQRTMEGTDGYKGQWKVQMDINDNGRYRWI